MSSGKIIAGVLAGVAVGVAIGILIAPDKGSETRRKIAEKGGEYTDGFEDKFNDFIDSISKQFANLKKEASDAAENMQTEDGNDMGPASGATSGTL